jgi:hypothetical protein
MPDSVDHGAHLPKGLGGAVVPHVGYGVRVE